MGRDTVNRNGRGPRERARLVHHRGASRLLRESMESSGESAAKASMLNMHLAAALVGSERVQTLCPLPKERAGQRSVEHIRALNGPLFHVAVRSSEPLFLTLVDVPRRQLLFSLHGLSPALRARCLAQLCILCFRSHSRPPRRRSPHRAQTKKMCRWWREALIIHEVDTNWPTQQDLCSVCACFSWVHHYRQLLGIPRRRGGGRPRPESSFRVLIINCDRELWFHSFTRVTKSSMQPGRPASSDGFGRVAQSRHSQDRPGQHRRVTDFNQPAFDNVRHERYHKRLPVPRIGSQLSIFVAGFPAIRTRLGVQINLGRQGRSAAVLTIPC